MPESQFILGLKKEIEDKIILHLLRLRFTSSHNALKSKFYNSMNCHDSVVMWSSVVLFILTFAVFGLFTWICSSLRYKPRGTDREAVIRENVSDNITQGSQSSSPDANEESG